MDPKAKEIAIRLLEAGSHNDHPNPVEGHGQEYDVFQWLRQSGCFAWVSIGGTYRTNHRGRELLHTLRTS